MANSVDPDQSLIWVYIVCPDLSVGKLRVITLHNTAKSPNNPCGFESALMDNKQIYVDEAKMGIYTSFRLYFIEHET